VFLCAIARKKYHLAFLCYLLQQLHGLLLTLRVKVYHGVVQDNGAFVLLRQSKAAHSQPHRKVQQIKGACRKILRFSGHRVPLGAGSHGEVSVYEKAVVFASGHYWHIFCGAASQFGRKAALYLFVGPFQGVHGQSYGVVLLLEALPLALHVLDGAFYHQRITHSLQSAVRLRDGGGQALTLLFCRRKLSAQGGGLRAAVGEIQIRQCCWFQLAVAAFNVLQPSLGVGLFLFGSHARGVHAPVFLHRAVYILFARGGISLQYLTSVDCRLSCRGGLFFEIQSKQDRSSG